MIGLLILASLWMLACTIAAWRVFVKRPLDASNVDRAVSSMLESLPFLNRARRRMALRAMRRRNLWERVRQGFGPRGSWRGLMSRSKHYSVKLSTPDGP